MVTLYKWFVDYFSQLIGKGSANMKTGNQHTSSWFYIDYKNGMMRLRTTLRNFYEEKKKIEEKKKFNFDSDAMTLTSTETESVEKRVCSHNFNPQPYKPGDEQDETNLFITFRHDINDYHWYVDRSHTEDDGHEYWEYEFNKLAIQAQVDLRSKAVYEKFAEVMQLASDPMNFIDQWREEYRHEEIKKEQRKKIEKNPQLLKKPYYQELDVNFDAEEEKQYDKQLQGLIRKAIAQFGFTWLFRKMYSYSKYRRLSFGEELLNEKLEKYESSVGLVACMDSLSKAIKEDDPYQALATMNHIRSQSNRYEKRFCEMEQSFATKIPIDRLCKAKKQFQRTLHGNCLTANSSAAKAVLLEYLYAKRLHQSYCYVSKDEVICYYNTDAHKSLSGDSETESSSLGILNRHNSKLDCSVSVGAKVIRVERVAENLYAAYTKESLRADNAVAIFTINAERKIILLYTECPAFGRSDGVSFHVIGKDSLVLHNAKESGGEKRTVVFIRPKAKDAGISSNVLRYLHHKDTLRFDKNKKPHDFIFETPTKSVVYTHSHDESFMWGECEGGLAIMYIANGQLINHYHSAKLVIEKDGVYYLVSQNDMRELAINLESGKIEEVDCMNANIAGIEFETMLERPLSQLRTISICVRCKMDSEELYGRIELTDYVQDFDRAALIQYLQKKTHIDNLHQYFSDEVFDEWLKALKTKDRFFPTAKVDIDMTINVSGSERLQQEMRILEQSCHSPFER